MEIIKKTNPKYGFNVILLKHEEFGPEDMAMLQALYSRSHKSVLDHIEEGKTCKSGDFMKRYYVGYGHDSIADCGTVTLFVEGVSILAAKMIQDDPLYNGQESSTRYIDFTENGFVEVENNANVCKHNIELFKEVYDYHLAKLRTVYNMNDPVRKRAVEAKAFDRSRGYLPIMTKTQLSWTTSLRRLKYGLKRLVKKYTETSEIYNENTGETVEKYNYTEPLEIAKTIYEVVCEAFPATFDNSKTYDYIFNDLDKWPQVLKILNLNDKLFGAYNRETVYVDKFIINASEFYNETKQYVDVHDMKMHGQIHIRGLLDYGSWRDLARHRNGFIEFVYPNSWMCEFNDYYIVNCFEIPKADKFYKNTLGHNVHVNIMWTLDEFVYVTRLRSQPTVHYTLRKFIQNVLRAACQTGLEVFWSDRVRRFVFEYLTDDVYIERGKQTIEKHDK